MENAVAELLGSVNILLFAGIARSSILSGRKFQSPDKIRTKHLFAAS